MRVTQQWKLTHETLDWTEWPDPRNEPPEAKETTYETQRDSIKKNKQIDHRVAMLPWLQTI